MVFASGWLGIPEQFCTIALLLGVFLCLMPSFAVASVAASLVGNQVGSLRVKAARFLYWNCLMIMWFVAVGLCILVEFYKHFIEDKLTDDITLQNEIEAVYHIFALVIFIESMRTMLKGFLRGLGI